MMQITYMRWRYVEDYDFYDVILEIDGHEKKAIYINRHQLDALDMQVPDAVEFLLRAKLVCEPIRGIEKSVDER